MSPSDRTSSSTKCIDTQTKHKEVIMTLNKRSDTTYSLPHRQHNKSWKFRNKDIYGHSKEEEEAIHLQKLKTTVRREYERRLTYPTRIQWRYFTRTVSDRVNDTAQMLQAWYINLKTAIAANEERPIVAIGTG